MKWIDCIEDGYYQMVNSEGKTITCLYDIGKINDEESNQYRFTLGNKDFYGNFGSYIGDAKRWCEESVYECSMQQALYYNHIVDSLEKNLDKS